MLTLARGLGADVISTDVDPALIDKMGFGDVKIISLGPLSRTEPLRQIQATYKYATCDFRGRYDFYIFSGNWAHHASRKHHPNLYYNHGHVRVFYDLKEETLRPLSNPLTRLAARAWIAGHTVLDKRSVARIDHAVANSEFTARRFKKYLGKDSTVVYPPVETAQFHYISDDGFWLSVNRLFPEKRIELQLDAFRRMPEERLVIVGGSDKGEYSGSYARGIMASLPPNVTVLGEIPGEKLIELYGRCRGLIATSRDEPFGMNAVEAMAAGKPVVAVKEGGFLETVIDGVTGVLVEATPEGVARGLKLLKDPAAYKNACQERAKTFDTSVFLGRMRELVEG